MKKYGLIASGFLIAIPPLLTVINIAQNGSSTPDGRTPTQILGVAAGTAGPDDVARLSKADVMQLFYALPAHGPVELDGEYTAVLVDVGVLSSGSAWFTHNLFGDGRWLGKGFRAIGSGEADTTQSSATDASTKGGGYNLFAGSSRDDFGGDDHAMQDEPDEIVRLREFDTYAGPSQIDERESFHLDYGRHNSGTVQSMRDEIRRINDRLYLGMGHMALGGGAINPAPFLLVGPAKRPARAKIDEAN